MLKNIYRLFHPAKHPNVIRSEYGIPETISLKIKVTKDGYFVATSPDLPGLITQAKGASELLDMINDAILTYYDVPKKDGDIVMDVIQIDGFGKISYAQKQLQAV